MDRLQVDSGVFLDRQQEEIILLVLHEKVFRVPAGDLVAQRHRFRDGKDRRVIPGAVLDAEIV